ncbi:hypothetical protein BS50DRAFT_380342 [Corynespora cassiicola Philippines]|uniref:Uncharacterized protein n=1 Tax=Corynespora cassiicola Philippines TaxID=1448308 RepID=A0A2T2NNM1_CORCC|nr:hypothetical protein BS50DRAFT_380342 [Corynespora cassiicola Philippines]
MRAAMFPAAFVPICSLSLPPTQPNMNGPANGGRPSTCHLDTKLTACGTRRLINLGGLSRATSRLLTSWSSAHPRREDRLDDVQHAAPCSFIPHPASSTPSETTQSSASPALLNARRLQLCLHCCCCCCCGRHLANMRRTLSDGYIPPLRSNRGPCCHSDSDRGAVAPVSLPSRSLSLIPRCSILAGVRLLVPGAAVPCIFRLIRHGAGPSQPPRISQLPSCGARLDEIPHLGATTLGWPSCSAARRLLNQANHVSRPHEPPTRLLTAGSIPRTNPTVRLY